MWLADEDQNKGAAVVWSFTPLSPGMLRGAERLSQPLQFLEVTEHGEQADNQNGIAGEWHLQLGPADDEGEAENGAGEDKGKAAHKLDEEPDEGIAKLRQGRVKAVAQPVTTLHQGNRCQRPHQLRQRSRFMCRRIEQCSAVERNRIAKKDHSPDRLEEHQVVVARTNAHRSGLPTRGSLDN